MAAASSTAAAAAAALVTPRSLYRWQLATARLFDSTPGLKSLLSLAGTPSPTSPTLHPHSQACLAAYLRGSPVYTPPKPLAGFIQRAYRGRALGVVKGGGVAAGGWEEGEEAQYTLEGGIAAQRELKRLCDIAMVVGSGVNGQAATYHASHPWHAETERWLGRGGGGLGEADAVRPGVLLLDHPATLHPGRGVTLVYDIARGVREVEGHENWVMRGLTLNRPYPSPVSTILPALAAALGPVLGGAPLFHGGNDGGEGALFVLHRLGDLPGAVPVDGPPPEGEGEGEGGTHHAHLSRAPSGLFLGGDVEAMKAAVGSGKAKVQDFRFLLGHTEVVLKEEEEEEGGGGLSLPPGMLESMVLAAGPGVAAHALCPPLFDTLGPYAGGVGLGGAPVVGYNYGRFWHQNSAWGCAMREVGAWVETEDRARGLELQGYTAPSAHAAVAHYYAAGLSVEDVMDIERESSQG
jgi:hypothetical protein